MHGGYSSQVTHTHIREEALFERKGQRANADEDGEGNPFVRRVTDGGTCAIVSVM